MINFLTYGFMGIGIGVIGGIIVMLITAMTIRLYKKKTKKENVDKLVTLKEIMTASRMVWDQITYNKAHTEKVDTNVILEYVHQIGLINIGWQHIQFITENPNVFGTEATVLNWLIIQEIQMKQQDLAYKQHSTLH